MPGTRKLGKTTDQRRAMLRQQVTDFLDNGRMESTVTRCKEIRPLAEKMITLGKKGDLAAYRKAMTFMTREDVVHKVFKEIAPSYMERSGGYTRITRPGGRRGDRDDRAGLIFPTAHCAGKKPFRVWSTTHTKGLFGGLCPGGQKNTPSDRFIL